MVCLNSTSKSLTIELTNTPARPLQWTTHYATKTSTQFNEASTDGTIANTTPVTIIASPTGTNIISVREVTVYNPNNANVTFIVSLVSGGNERVVYRDELKPFQSWSSLGHKSSVPVSYNDLIDVPTTAEFAAELNALTGTNRLSFNSLKDTLTVIEIATQLNALTGADRIDYDSLQNTPTPAEIAADLNALTGTDRISYNSLQDVP